MRRLRDLLTTRGRAFVAAGITLVLCGIGLGFTDLTRIGVLLVSLPLLSGLLMRRHDLRFSLERAALPGRIQVDEQSLVTLRIENAGGAASPLLMAEEQLDYALGDRPRFVVPRLRRGDRQEVHYSVRSHVRGRHRLGPLGVRLRDPFGLSTRVAAISGPATSSSFPRSSPSAAASPRAAVWEPKAPSPTWSPCTARTTSPSAPTVTVTTCVASTGRPPPRRAS